MLNPIRRRLEKRAHRKGYRAMVRRCYADGGDDPDRRMAGIQQGRAAPPCEYHDVRENWTRKTDREDQAQ